MIIALAAGLYMDHVNIYFDQNKQQTTATVIKKSQKRADTHESVPNTYFVHFSFQDADDKQITPREKVTFELFEQVNAGDKVPVWYLPKESTFNSLSDPAKAGQSVMWVFAGMASFIALCIFLFGLNRAFPFLPSITGILLQTGFLLIVAGLYFHIKAPTAPEPLDPEATSQMDSAAGFYMLASLVFLIAGISWLLRRSRLKRAKTKVEALSL